MIAKRFSGHSKWSTIKHDKTANDQARSKHLSKLCRQITNAARTSGSLIAKLNQDPATNLSLKSAISTAKQNQVPKANIEAAIRNAASDKSGDALVGGMYEILCKGGVAVLAECVTNNRNRLIQELKHGLGKRGGTVGANVQYLFEKCGRIVYSAGGSGMDVNLIVERVIEEADGVEDMRCITLDGVDCVEVVCKAKETVKCRESIQLLGLEIRSVEMFYDTKDKVALDDECGAAFGSVLEFLDAHEDVVSVHHNCEE